MPMPKPMLDPQAQPSAPCSIASCMHRTSPRGRCALTTRGNNRASIVSARHYRLPLMIHGSLSDRLQSGTVWSGTQCVRMGPSAGPPPPVIPARFDSWLGTDRPRSRSGLAVGGSLRLMFTSRVPRLGARTRYDDRLLCVLLRCGIWTVVLTGTCMRVYRYLPT